MLVIARSQEPLQKLKEQYGSQVEYLTGDLADLSIGKKAVDKALASFGRLDGLVLNHGILGQVGKIAEADPQQWKHGFDVNFMSAVAFVSGLLLARIRRTQMFNIGPARCKLLSLRFESPREESFSLHPELPFRPTRDGVYTVLRKLL